MKKIAILLVFIFVATIYAEDFKFYSFGEFAYYPMKEDHFVPEGVYFSTNIGVGIEYKWFFVDVNQNVDITKSDRGLIFKPYKEQYYVTAGINFWVIQVGYEHLCTHNVDRSHGYFNQYDKVYINFDTRRLK